MQFPFQIKKGCFPQVLNNEKIKVEWIEALVEADHKYVERCL